MHIVTGELRKDTFIKQGVGKDGKSTMFGLELSEMVKDFRTGEKTYTNYKAIVFASSPGQVDYYMKSLVKGNWLSLTAEKLKPEVSESNGKQYIRLEMVNARVETCGYIDSSQQQAPQQQAPQQQAPQQQAPQQQAPQQQAPQQAPQAAPQAAPAELDSWDKDIPF